MAQVSGNTLTTSSPLMTRKLSPAAPFISAAKKVGSYLSQPMQYTTSARQNAAQAPVNFDSYQNTTVANPVQKPSTTVNTAKVAPAQSADSTVSLSGGTKGLLTPDLNSLSSSLKNIQGGLASIQKEREGKFSAEDPNLYGKTVAALANKSTTPSVATMDAINAYQEAVKRLADFDINVADMIEGNRLNAIALPYMQGRESAIQTANTAKRNALQGAVQQQQAAIGFGQTQQNLEQSALTSAASSAKPEQYGLTSTPFNPTTGTFGTMPGGEGGAFSAGRVQGDLALGQQYASNISSNNQAKTVKANIQAFLAGNPDLNPSAFTDVNSVIQFLSGKTSNAQYKVLSNMLNEYLNTLAPILGVGGDVTNLKTQIAQSFLDAKASGASISQILEGIEQLADAKVAAQAGGSRGAPVGGSTSGSIWDF